MIATLGLLQRIEGRAAQRADSLLLRNSLKRMTWTGRRITFRFSGGALPPVPWHFMPDRPLQPVVMRLRCASHSLLAPDGVFNAAPAPSTEPMPAPKIIPIPQSPSAAPITPPMPAPNARPLPDLIATRVTSLQESMTRPPSASGSGTPRVPVVWAARTRESSLLRITPQFSDGVLPHAPWHFMCDRPLQLLVIRQAAQSNLSLFFSAAHSRRYKLIKF
jgi:hypothetical protein